MCVCVSVCLCVCVCVCVCVLVCMCTWLSAFLQLFVSVSAFVCDYFVCVSVIFFCECVHPPLIIPVTLCAVSISLIVHICLWYLLWLYICMFCLPRGGTDFLDLSGVLQTILVAAFMKLPLAPVKIILDVFQPFKFQLLQLLCHCGFSVICPYLICCGLMHVHGSTVSVKSWGNSFVWFVLPPVMLLFLKRLAFYAFYQHLDLLSCLVDSGCCETVVRFSHCLLVPQPHWKLFF